MKDSKRQYQKIAINLLLATIVLLLMILVVPRIIIFFMPFIVGWIIAAIANPPVQFIEKKLKVKRKAISVIMIVLVIGAVAALVYLFCWLLFTQAYQFIVDLPNLWEGFEGGLNSIGDHWTGFVNKLPEGVQENWGRIMEGLSESMAGLTEKITDPAVEAIGNFAKSIPNVIISVVMCLLSAYFFVAERDYVSGFFKNYIPISVQQKWVIGFRSMKKAVGGYFLAQFRIEVWVYILLVIGLLILKVQYAFIFAFLIALLDFLPVFGAGAILWPWALVRFLNNDYRMAIGLMIVWGVGQLVRQMIQPKFISDSVGLKPLPTLFLLFIGFKIDGVLGMIIAIPVGIIIVNLNEAGVFDTTKNSIRLLVKKLNDFRHLDEQDIADIKADDAKANNFYEEIDNQNFSDDADDEPDWMNDNRYNDIKREITDKLKEKKNKKKEKL